MNTITIKTSELTGKALDYSVQLAMLLKRGMTNIDAAKDGAKSLAKSGDRAYSTNWAQCGPLMDDLKLYPQRYDDGCEDVTEDNRYFCIWGGSILDIDKCEEGPTALIAACRAIVAAELGKTVDVPVELV